MLRKLRLLALPGALVQSWGMLAEAQGRPAHHSIFRRIFANTAWLLGGKGYGGLCSLAYLAILSRSLGLKDFGHFSLIFSTAQALIAIAGFQTWQSVVRYGAIHVHARDWPRLGMLTMFCGAIDTAGAVAGCIIAFVLFYPLAAALHLNPKYIDLGFAFSCALLWARVTAPAGLLRAIDRFDAAVSVDAMVPTARLIAAIGIWIAGPTVERFLIAWAAIELISGVAYWAMARRLCPQAVRLKYLLEWRRALRDNEGIGGFLMITSVGTTLDACYRQGPILAIGYVLGTRTAGLYRLSDQLAQGLGKLSTMLMRAVYFEVARARVATSLADFRQLVRRISLGAGAAGTILVVLAVIAGGRIVAVVGGHDFTGGASILVPLVIAASFDLASVAFEPVLHSTGNARHSLAARFAAVAALSAALMALIHDGASSAAWAVALAGAVGYGAMGWMVYRALRTLAQSAEEPPVAVCKSQ